MLASSPAVTWALQGLSGTAGESIQITDVECLVSASHQLALITSLPFVHTARRSYRLHERGALIAAALPD
jgi:hypothetical protein